MWIAFVSGEFQRSQKHFFCASEQQSTGAPGFAQTAWRWVRKDMNSSHAVPEPAGSAQVASLIQQLGAAEQAQRIAESRYAHLVDAAPDAILVIDVEQRILLFNHSAELLFGYSAQEVLGQELEILLPPEIVLTHRAQVQRFAESGARFGKPGHPYVRARRRDDATIPVETTFSRFDAEGQTLFTVIVRDSSEKEHAAAELRERAREFELLYEMSNDLAGQHELDSLLEMVVQRAVELVHSTGGAVFLYQPETESVRVVATRNTSIAVGFELKLGKGLAGRAAAERRTLVANDFGLWERPAFAALSPVTTALAAPMLFQGELIGVLGVLGDRAGSEFTETDARLLELFATQAAGAVRNARHLQESRDRTTQLEMLYQAGLALHREHDLSAQLQVLLENTAKALHAERAAFWDYDPREKALHLEVTFGSPPHVASQWLGTRFELHSDRGIAALVARTRQPLNLPDAATDPRWFVTEPELKSAVWAPVVYQEELYGVLSISSTRPAAFTTADMQVLVLYANLFANTLETTRLLNETRQRVHQLQALHTVHIAISASFDLPLILDIYLDVVIKELQVDAVDILLYDAMLLQLTYVAGRGFHTRARAGQSLLRQDPLAGRVLMERRVVRFPDPLLQLQAPEFFHGGAEGFTNYVGVPLETKGQLKGVLELFQRGPLRTEGEWFDFVNILARQAALAIDSVMSYEALQHSNYELGVAYDATIEGWSRALDLRDKETEGHTRRVTELTLQLVRRLGIPEAEWEHVRRGALLHDIGKMGIPDAILSKPGPLTEAEWKIMKRHPQYAYDLLSPIAYLRPALAIPYCHHEQWDGSGYPRGLQGQEIPLVARAFAVVDVWDALTSERPYRPAWSNAQAKQAISSKSEQHFDPRIVPIFLELIGGF